MARTSSSRVKTLLRSLAAAFAVYAGQVVTNFLFVAPGSSRRTSSVAARTHATPTAWWPNGGLVLGATRSSSPRRQHSSTTLSALSGVELGAQIGEAVLGLMVLYCIMSANEYIYHRYFQHLGINKLDIARQLRNTFNVPTYRGDGHVEHHRETLDDMSLEIETSGRREQILDVDPFRGTAFPWWATCVMSLSVIIPAFPILSLLGWSGPVIVLTSTAAVLAHALVWNALHPNMHGLPDVPLSHGVPSSVLAFARESPYFEYLRKNHEGHHRTDGAHGNYNVCCPGMDHVCGTHVGEVPPQAVPAGAA